jgi:hypothetical protein
MRVMSPGTFVTFLTALLALWRKDGKGQWTLAAHFQRPPDI